MIILILIIDIKERDNMKIRNVLGILFIFSVAYTQSMTEMVDKRGFHKKIFKTAPHHYVNKYSSQVIHYIDEQGIFREIPNGAEGDSLHALAEEQKEKLKNGTLGKTTTDPVPIDPVDNYKWEKYDQINNYGNRETTYIKSFSGDDVSTINQSEIPLYTSYDKRIGNYFHLETEDFQGIKGVISIKYASAPWHDMTINGIIGANHKVGYMEQDINLDNFSTQEMWNQIRTWIEEDPVIYIKNYRSTSSGTTTYSSESFSIEYSEIDEAVTDAENKLTTNQNTYLWFGHILVQDYGTLYNQAYTIIGDVSDVNLEVTWTDYDGHFSGDVVDNVTISDYETVYIDADVNILASSIWNVGKGVTIYVADNARINIYGTLIINGISPVTTITIKSATGTGHSQWDQIYVGSGGSLDADYVNIQNATLGVTCSGNPDGLDIDNTNFSDCNYGIYLYGTGYPYLSNMYFMYNTFDCDYRGAHLRDLSIVLKNSKFYESSSNGVWAYDDAHVYVVNCQFYDDNGKTLERGIGCSNAYVSSDYNTFTDLYLGIYSYNGGNINITNYDSETNNYFHDNTYGVYIFSGAGADLGGHTYDDDDWDGGFNYFNNNSWDVYNAGSVNEEASLNWWNSGYMTPNNYGPYFIHSTGWAYTRLGRAPDITGLPKRTSSIASGETSESLAESEISDVNKVYRKAKAAFRSEYYEAAKELYLQVLNQWPESGEAELAVTGLRFTLNEAGEREDYLPMLQALKSRMVNAERAFHLDYAILKEKNKELDTRQKIQRLEEFYQQHKVQKTRSNRILAQVLADKAVFLEELAVFPDIGYGSLEKSAEAYSSEAKLIYQQIIDEYPNTPSADMVGNEHGLEKSITIILPSDYALHAAYPNPFNPSTTITFDLPDVADVSLAVYNIRGRQVAELAKGEMQSGSHSVVFHANNFAAGIYFYRLTTGSFTQVRKMVLLK